LERPKRILIIADACSPLSQERGLVGIKGGHQIYWYSFPKADLKDLAGAVTPPMGRIRWLSFLFSPLFLKRAIRKIRPDLIHVFYAYQELNTLVIYRFKPLVVTVMGGDILPDQSFNGRRRRPVKKMLDSADVITSKSLFLDLALNQIGNYAHKIRRVTWGVDTKRFHTGVDVGFLRQRWNIQKDELVFFCPRLCQPIYNKHLNIQAFADYLEQARPRTKGKLIVAELFADEAYSRQLRGLVAKLGLTEQVCFVGAIPHQEMPAYFNLADIMVATPLSDGMPQSLYEAMACGTYPILGNLESYRELIQDGVNGRLVRVGDVEALGEAMCWAAAHQEQRRTAAIINRQRILEVADKDGQDWIVLSIYEELLKKYENYDHPDNG
jgi:glycosyltransferase involved in cell wall biosynthesis